METLRTHALFFLCLALAVALALLPPTAPYAVGMALLLGAVVVIVAHSIAVY